jgi:hypothetical protein
MMLFIPI